MKRVEYIIGLIVKKTANANRNSISRSSGSYNIFVCFVVERKKGGVIIS